MSLRQSSVSVFQGASFPAFGRLNFSALTRLVNEKFKYGSVGKLARLFILLAPISVLATGCAVHQPLVSEHPATMPAEYAESLEVRPAPAVDRWWAVFNDKGLDALMEEAFAGNLDLNRAYARFEQLAAVGEIAGAGRKPVLNLEAAGGRGRQAAPSGAVTSDNYRLSLAAGYELDLWQKIRSRTDAALLDAQASAEDINTLYLTLAAQIADLYFLAVEQRAQLRLVDQIISSFTDTLSRVENRYQQGLVPALDVYQSRQNLAQARARRPVFEANLAVTEHTLAVLAGRFPGRQTGGIITEIPQTLAELPVGLPSQLLQRRPDIQAAFLRLQASDERIGAAIAERFPSFSLVGSYGAASADLSNLLSSTNIFWNLLVNLTQPLFDGGRRQAEIERSRAVFEENLAAYHQTVLRAMQEVEDALVRGQATAARIASLEEGAAAATAALRLATDRYLQGLSDYLPVLTAQNSHFETESALLAARRQLIADRIQLVRALGGSWMERLVKERLQRNSEP
jgi:outer membrane protein, multidrug efflux system